MSAELPSDPDLGRASAPEPTGVFSVVEVLLPLPVTHAWTAYACRVAAIDKPRWNPATRVWRSRARLDDGTEEIISISNGATPRALRVMAEWSAARGAPRIESETARRVVSAFVIGMQGALSRRRES